MHFQRCVRLYFLVISPEPIFFSDPSNLKILLHSLSHSSLSFPFIESRMHRNTPLTGQKINNTMMDIADNKNTPPKSSTNNRTLLPNWNDPRNPHPSQQNGCARTRPKILADFPCMSTHNPATKPRAAQFNQRETHAQPPCAFNTFAFITSRSNPNTSDLGQQQQRQQQEQQGRGNIAVH